VFRTLFGLAHRRTAVEAVVLYLAYLAVGLLLSGAGGQVLGLFDFDPVLNIPALSGPGVAVGVSVYTATAILRSRRLLSSPLNAAAAVFVLPVAYFGGLALGLVLPALLSTRPDGPAKRETLKLA
jgi:hypothetical protein